MAAVASPYVRRTVVRKHSPLAAQKVGDSSDDEDLAPIKLSAEAEELLGEEDDVLRSARRDIKSLQEEHRRKLRESLSPRVADGSPAPRVVKLGSGSRPSIQGTLGRDGSFMYRNKIQATVHQPQIAPDSITPAPRFRRVRVSGSRSQTRSSPSSSTASNEADNNVREEKVDSESSTSKTPGSEEQVNASALSDAAPIGPSTIMRPRRGDENLGQSTMRVKRIGPGSLLSGPVRRGMIRRPSDEDDVNQTNGRESPEQPAIEHHDGLQGLVDSIPEKPQHPAINPVPQRRTRSPEQEHHHASVASSTIASASEAEHQELPAAPRIQEERPKSPYSNASHPSSRSSGKRVHPIFKMPPLPALPSAHDQENEPPPTFKKSKPSSTMLGEVKKVSVLSEAKTNASRTPQTASPERKPLAPRSQNTPHRPAPAPPPKMSIIEAATSTAGSARKKKISIMMNGRMYSRLDCIGRGGSSRVYRVMAENYKMFALKRVTLEDADSAAIAGYRGEIDLLKKLENVERVVRLFDYEVNDEKGTLCVLMEMGEADFNQMLNKQLKHENARLDVSFTRHYWKEMLECVHAVHQYDIVHSDLKPANFLLVQGRLKLIDFGIANAIQDDTVNVHRENQIGTPNYMSPESLICHTEPGSGGVKDIRLGKPSDVWSLGCILYQMTYGQPPFAHIQNQIQRITSIVKPEVEIKYNATGVGGVTVPFGLIKTLRRCLQRQQHLRPTIRELLGDADPFLNAVAISPDMLGRMISNVVRHCRRKEEELRAEGAVGKSAIPTDEDIKAWPMAFYEKLRQAQQEGTAW